MATTVRFQVFGKPQQRGSKSARVRYNTAGQPVTKDGRVLTFAKDDNEKSKNWMQEVRAAASKEYNGDLLEGPITLLVTFSFPRPTGHIGSGRNSGSVKPSAPIHHTQAPDLDKLTRSINDALTGVIWRDDKQVISINVHKQWVTTAANAWIEVRESTELTPNEL